MRKLLATLYVSKPDYYLGREGLNVLIRKEDKVIFRIPIQNLESIICFNYLGISPALMELCVESNVGICFMNAFSGKFLARLQGPISGNVLLRKEQYRISDHVEMRIEYAKSLIFAKNYNSMKVLQRALRDHKDIEDKEKIQQAVESLKKTGKEIKDCELEERLLGLEGDAAREYFGVLNNLVLKKKDFFEFSGRNRRPPLDPTNALLSLTYSMIRIMVENALETVGLDAYVGFFHKDRPGRSGLALDMMEELRAYMGDRFVLSIINLGQMDEEDFYRKENEAVLLTEGGMKKYLELWKKRLDETIKHPFLEEEIEIGLLPYAQAMLLARTIRGDLEQYPPFFMS